MLASLYDSDANVNLTQTGHFRCYTYLCNHTCNSLQPFLDNKAYLFHHYLEVALMLASILVLVLALVLSSEFALVLVVELKWVQGVDVFWLKYF